jgi:DNA polymerase III subunit epsilon
MRYAIIDIETTGGSTKSTKITEVAILIHNGTEIVEEFCTLINPECDIPPFISRLTGIRNEMVVNAPRFFEIAKKIVEFTKDTVFVAHNVGFDYNVIRHEFKSLGFDYRLPHLCTVRAARYTFPGYKSYGLDKITQALDIQLEGHHRARNDAMATAKLFEVIFEKNVGNLNHFIQKEINPKELHPLLDTEAINQVINQIGVYKFFDDSGRLIYIGKSKHIRSRIQQHLKNNTSKKAMAMKQEIARIDAEYTGSELIALLLESKLIKQHKPNYNRQLRKDRQNYGIYDFEDGRGYLNLTIERTNKMQALPILTFENKTDASAYLMKLCERHELCQKLTGLYATKSACFQYHTKQCHGACVGEEPTDAYNLRLQTWMDGINFENQNFFIVESGRSRLEKSLILVENGVYRGFGFIPISAMNSGIKDWKDFITYYNEDRDSKIILKSYMNRFSELQIRTF